MFACGVLIASAVLGFAMVTGAGPASASSVVGGCEPTKIKYQAAIHNSNTTSTSFVTVPEATVGFVQGGVGASCVLVEFWAEATAAKVMYVRVLMDNATAGLPASTVFTADDDEDNDGCCVRTRGMKFILPNVTPGNHKISVQYLSFDGSVVGLQRHTTIVHYVP
jgi:hypothetical protein